MKKIIAFGASNSRRSINKDFAQWAAQQVENADVELLDLNDFEMPIYSIDREQDSGIPQKAIEFKNKIRKADGLVMSFAEHNGSYSSAFKNIMDWISRIEQGTWSNKPTLLLATSPGPRGAQGVLNTAKMSFPYQGASVKGSFSLPSFGQNFNGIGIEDESLKAAFEVELYKLEEEL